MLGGRRHADGLTMHTLELSTSQYPQLSARDGLES